jgi:hypothetical protein
MCGGFFALRSLPMRPPELFSVFTCIFPFFFLGLRSLCVRPRAAVGRYAPIKAPPLPPLRGGLRGLPKEVKDGEAYPTHTATTLYRQKRKKPNIYTIYRGLSPPYVQSIAQKKPYMSRASTAWGLSPPLDIGFFCALALIRGKSPSLSIVCSYFSGCDILTSV